MCYFYLKKAQTTVKSSWILSAVSTFSWNCPQGFRGFGHNKFKAFQGRFQQIFKAANDKTGGRSDHQTLVDALFNN